MPRVSPRFKRVVAMDERKERGLALRAERARKVAEVMRENLRKRKAQERARQAAAPEGPAGQPADGASEAG
jgi:hypothetical protein